MCHLSSQYYSTTILLHFWHQMCGLSTHQTILWQEMDILQFNSILTLPKDSISSHRPQAQSHMMVPHLPCRCKSHIQVIITCASDPTTFPMTASLGWINLLQRLKEVRKTININSGMVERGLLWTIWHPFCLYGSGTIERTDDKRSNVITKYTLISLVT